ncbi:MAG: nucleoside deaminase [Oscillospiraceae bacterium]|nr:nucleoside deaminase [Oscillospiraceae bacterium]
MNRFMKMAIEEATEGITHGHGGPFGCVVVKDGTVIGHGHNEVLRQNDPTCHGEVMAIRDACRTLGTYDLSGCELYTTAAPCPMCLGAILWSNITKYYFGCRVTDTADIGFRDDVFYSDPVYTAEETDREECLELFRKYDSLRDKKIY